MSNLLNMFNPFAPQQPSKGNSNLVTKVPTQENAIVCKLVGDIFSKQAFVEVTSFGHQVRPGMTYQHPSRKSLGLADSDYENESYWEAFNLVKELKNKKSLNSDDEKELKKAEATMEIFKPNTKAWLFFVEPNSSQIKALKVSKMIIDQLWGRTFKNKAPIPSLLETMKREGVSPYDLGGPKANEGWIKIYKTGEGKFGTQYHVEPHKADVTVDTPDGPISGKRYVKLGVHPDLLGEIDPATFPKPLDFEKKYVFTDEESKVFTDSLGRVVPDRFLKKDDDEESSDAPTQPVTETKSVSNLPF